MIAALVAGCVMLLLPGLAAYAGYRSTSSILSTEAEINARLVSQLVNVNPELWQVETLRLEELLRRRPGDRTAESRSVLDLQDRVISQVEDELASPRIETRAPVHDAGEVVGTIRIERSLRPLIAQIAWFALLGSVLAGAIFAALRVLPLRTLRRTQDRLLHEATHDGLTGLPNRVLFRDRLEQAMGRAQRSRRPMALLFMDLDNFKDINDSLGHNIGDLVLRHVARMLGNSLTAGAGPARRSNDGAFTIARLGGDEFTAIVESAGSTEDTAALASRILAALQEPTRIAGNQIILSASIGIAMYPQDNADMATLLRQADMAMYRAKDLGRNTHHFFNDELNHAIQHRIALDHSLGTGTPGVCPALPAQGKFVQRRDHRCRSTDPLATTGRGAGSSRQVHRRARRQSPDRACGRVGHCYCLRTIGHVGSHGIAGYVDGGQPVGAPVS